MHLKQPKPTNTACWQFTEHREKIEKFRETGSLKDLYRNKLDKACFDHDAAYTDGKYLAKRTISDTVLNYRAYEIAGNVKYDRYNRALASMVYKTFNKKTGPGTTAASKAGVSINEQLAEELHKPVIKKFKRKKPMRDLKTIFGQQIQLKWDHCLLRIKMLNIYILL